MKNALRSLVIIICFILTICFFSSNTSVAKTNTKANRSLEITSKKSDLFYIVRVIENGRPWLYFYLTYNNLYITKIEEL